jgi:predicted  nucleic acid-binding Zn-ribbon protein
VRYVEGSSWSTSVAALVIYTVVPHLQDALSEAKSYASNIADELSQLKQEQEGMCAHVQDLQEKLENSNNEVQDCFRALPEILHGSF